MSIVLSIVIDNSLQIGLFKPYLTVLLKRRVLSLTRAESWLPYPPPKRTPLSLILLQWYRVLPFLTSQTVGSNFRLSYTTNLPRFPPAIKPLNVGLRFAGDFHYRERYIIFVDT